MNVGKPLNLHIVSLGCAKNLVDSEVMGGLARKAGIVLTDQITQADFVLVNTCAFINPAKEESIETILSIAREKQRQGLNFKLVVAGCLAQRYGRQLLRDLPEVDLFIGTGEVGRVVRHLQTLAAGPKRVAVVSNPDFLMTSDHERILPEGAFSANLKIADGCSNRCTYCAIPDIRGPARSREPEDILREAQSLAKRGIKELLIIGQDTSAYGRDLKSRPSLSGLLEELASIDGIRWIRLLYSHPAHLSAETLSVMARRDKICRYIDLPVQHIDDTLLAAMNRRADADQIRSVISQARVMMPDVALRTSLIVGFPGETPKRFERLIAFVRETKFDHLGVFTYSREEGTAAAAMPSRISEKEKERRRDIVMNEQAEISLAINRTLIGSTQEVLIEGKSDRPDYVYMGRCRRQAPEIDGVTYLAHSSLKIGDLVHCVITNADHYDLFADLR